MMKYFFKVSLIVALFLVATNNGVAQKDTLFFPPYSYFVIDNEEWVVRESNKYVKLRKKDNMLLEVKARYHKPLGMTGPENFLENAQKAMVENDKLVVASSTKLDEKTYLLEIIPNIDECSEFEFPKEFLSIKIYFIVRYIDSQTIWTLELDDDMYILMQAFPLKDQLLEIYSYAQFTTPQEMDRLLGYPLTESRINYEVHKEYQKEYNQNYNELLKKRKCYDDESLLETLKMYHPAKLIDSLARYQKDSTLANLYAQKNAESRSEAEKLNLQRLAELNYTHSEYYSLLEKSQNSGFSLNDYLALALGNRPESGISRFLELSNASGQEIRDNDYHSIVAELIRNEEKLDSTFDYIEIYRVDDSLGVVVLFSLQKLQSKNYFIIRENGSYSRKSFSTPNEFQQGTNDKTWDDLSPYIPNDMLNFRMYSNTIIQYSKHKNILLLSSKTNKPQYYQSASNFGSEWKKISSMPIDSSSYLMISTEFENTSRHGSIRWDQFNNQNEKKRLENLIIDLTGKTFEDLCERDSLGVIKSIDDAARYIIRANVKPEYLLYTSNSIADVDGDKQDELIHLAISNGKIITQSIFKLNNGVLEKIPAKNSLKIFEKNTAVLNTLLISQIKNHTQEKLDDPQRLFGFDEK